MYVARAGEISLAGLIAVYWLIVVVGYMLNGRMKARRALIRADGQVVLSGRLSIGRTLAILLGPPLLLWVVLWLATSS